MPRSRKRKIVTVLGVIVLLAAALTGYNRFKAGQGPAPAPGPAAPSTTQARTQPAWCPTVEVLAAPGTWESSVTDDPIHPSQFPNSLLLNVTKPLQATFASNRVKVWTLNYPAQFRNIGDMNQLTYDDSRTQGQDRLTAEMREMNSQCPLTKFVMVGFSQGAVITGDVLSDIGNNRGVVPADTILGATLIADGRRVAGLGVTVGYQPTGVGAEVAMQPLNMIAGAVVPGATMRGARDGGFGVLQDRTNELCAQSDQICDSPTVISEGLNALRSLAEKNIIHAQYATNPNVVEGTTATGWTVRWATDLIEPVLG